MGHETAQSNLVRTQVFGEKDDVVAVDRAADRGDAVAPMRDAQTASIS
jgi:hypothetical protein